MQEDLMAPRRTSLMAAAFIVVALIGSMAAPAAADPPTSNRAAACGNVALDTRHPEEIVRGQPDPYMVLQLRADTCQGYMYLKIVNYRAVGRTSCGTRFWVHVVTTGNHLLQALGCPAAGQSLWSITDGDSTGRYHWGSLTESFGGKTYVACVDEQGQGRCH
jgi:hypothetical protein